MDYQQIVCQATGKTIKADEMYKIRSEGNCIESIVSICKNCPYTDSKIKQCKNCYGTIVQKFARQLNEETGRIKMSSENYKNTFLLVDDEYIQMMDADEFLENMDVIANLNNSNWNHGQRISDNLRCYNAPSTAKTDCHNCKKRCHKASEKTACEKAKDYCISRGLDISTATSEQIAKIKLPIDCICCEQTQTCYYV